MRFARLEQFLRLGDRERFAGSAPFGSEACVVPSVT